MGGSHCPWPCTIASCDAAVWVRLRTSVSTVRDVNVPERLCLLRDGGSVISTPHHSGRMPPPENVPVPELSARCFQPFLS
jgi:hypothetical protein